MISSSPKHRGCKTMNPGGSSKGVTGFTLAEPTGIVSSEAVLSACLSPAFPESTNVKPDHRVRAAGSSKLQNAILLFLSVLIINGFQSRSARGADGFVLALDGINDYASAPENTSLDLGLGAGKSFTLECFFCLPATNQLGYASLIKKDQAYELGLDFQNSGVILNFLTGQSPGAPIEFSGGDLKPGFHHIAAVFANNTNPTVRTLFLDGRQIYQDGFRNFPTGINASLSPLSVGGAYGTNSFHGWLNDVRLSNIARYTNNSPLGVDATVYRIPTAPFIPDTNTVALWHFDEAPGTTSFMDDSGNANHLTARNGVTTGLTPVFQNAGMLDQEFYPGFGVEDAFSPDGVYALCILTNGQIVIGGQFLRVDGLAHTNLARLYADGSVDGSFNVTLNSDFGRASVNAIVLLPNNQLLIGGTFSAVNGVSRTGLARLNQDGSVDIGFPAVLTEPGDSVKTMVRQPDGKLIIFGSFSFISGYIRPNAARLNANGTLDPSFDAGPSATPLLGVNHILLQPDGKLLCNVNQYDFTTQLYTNLIRLNANGSQDASFQPVVTDFPLNENIALQMDGKVLLVGNFNTVNGVSRVGAARFLTNGLLDTAFSLTNNVGTIYTNGGWLDFVTIQPSGKILLGGTFYTGPYTGVPSVARFLPSGLFDPSFQPAEFFQPNNTIYASAFLSSGKIIIAGEFTDVNGYSRRGIARLYGDPVQPPSFLSIALLPGGGVRLDVTNPASQPLVLQSTTNLAAVSWQSIATNSLATNQCQFFHTNSPPSTTRFYRTMLLGQ